MRRKNVCCVCAIMAAACLVGACGKMESESRKKESVTVADEEREDQMKPVVEEAADQVEQGITIDYSIESYESVQKFGYDLFAQCIQDPNPVLSPVSAYLALSMAGCGADGTTQEEFYDVLGNDMMALSHDMMSTLPAEGDLLNLSIADSAWIDDAFIVDDTWLGTIDSLMDAETFQTDLSTKETMNEINRWVDDKTNGLIDKMLDRPLDEMARLALFNTVYFKGKWEFPFDANDTHKEDFYLDREQRTAEQVQIPD